MKVKTITALVMTATAVQAAEQPNILLITVDDLKPILGCYGDEMVQTPNIDRLAARGTVFLNNYCQQAVCAPSRMSIFTGLRPDTTGVTDLKTDLRVHLPDAKTMQQHFKENGYETLGCGKVMHGSKNEDPPSWSVPFMHDEDLVYADGFETPADLQYQSPEIHAAFEQVQKEGITHWKKRKQRLVELNARPPVECIDVPDDAYADGAMTTWSIEQMQKLSKGRKPFFITVGFHKPHLPFVAPKKYWDLYDRDQFKPAELQTAPKGAPDYAGHTWGELRGYSSIPKGKGALPLDRHAELIHAYHACVSAIDAQVGRLLDALDESGEADNTIIVLWGDHGWHLGDHGWWCKHTNYEQATKAPLIISSHLPEKMPPGATRSMSEFVDLYPTLCELTGVPAPDGLEGKSLVPVLKDETAEVKQFSVSQYPRGKIMGYAYRTKRYRYVEWIKNGEIQNAELYDYETDPLETRNLIDDRDYRNVIEEIKKLIDPANNVDESVQEESPYPEPWVSVADASIAIDPCANMKWRDPDEKEAYQQVPEGDLLLHIFKPADWKATDRRPAIVFFHGGAWKTGDAKAFYWQSNYFASRGMVCISAEYRIESKHGTSPIESTLDAMHAMQTVRARAAELGIDPNRIAASGGSAGGHLAAAVASVGGFEDTSDALKNISPRPNALLLFNPVLDTTIYGFGSWWIKPTPADLSPINQMQGEQPPTIIFNGALDKTTTLERARAFAQKAQDTGNRCEVVVYPKAEHSFFNRGKGGNYFADTLTRADAFLKSLGWIE